MMYFVMYKIRIGYGHDQASSFLRLKSRKGGLKL